MNATYMNLRAKQATGSDGKPIRIGDTVQCISYYDSSLLNKAVVTEIVRQGADGTILHFATPPDSDFPHHLQHIARKAYRVFP